MSITGPLYRRSPRLFSKSKPGDWTLVWCELHESGEFWISSEPPAGTAAEGQRHCEREAAPESTTTAAAPVAVPGWASVTGSRRLVTLPVVDCDIAHVRADGRECIEITLPHNSKKETLSSHESSYDVDWWYAVSKSGGKRNRPTLLTLVALSG
ncbi:hypothetical protein P43SY_011233 [Pythium insidiosum]|uniref:Uncharacterized protein n=1 Tax=Pythium insidiosum TaxID=114742 RepID=A0AAD5LP51_PYTIN|nr:hypothetical protein P43SY_011233 [Pythium insidiosum]